METSLIRPSRTRTAGGSSASTLGSGEDGGGGRLGGGEQTPSTGLRHPFFNHCRRYAIGPRKLPANEQFFVVDAQTVASLLYTTQIVSVFFLFFYN